MKSGNVKPFRVDIELSEVPTYCTVLYSTYIMKLEVQSSIVYKNRLVIKLECFKFVFSLKAITYKSSYKSIPDLRKFMYNI